MSLHYPQRHYFDLHQLTSGVFLPMTAVMAWYSLLPPDSQYAYLESAIVKCFIVLGVLIGGPGWLLVLYDIVVYFFRIAAFEVMPRLLGRSERMEGVVNGYGDMHKCLMREPHDHKKESPCSVLARNEPSSQQEKSPNDTHDAAIRGDDYYSAGAVATAADTTEVPVN
ncbi:hypothetical protein KEM52_001381 [Ascosphaera acerosa]|nr:hypothetical protein KEM52_001381 [Ascosphaera acerosa]